ncbi:hypothetical protein FOL47_002349, partial [Perkinsus chesapeaki]
VDMELDSSVTSTNTDYSKAEGAMRLKFPSTWKKAATTKGTEEMVERRDHTEEEVDSDTIKKEDSTPDDNIDDTSKIVEEWGLLLQVGIAYVGRGARAIVDDDTLIPSGMTYLGSLSLDQ